MHRSRSLLCAAVWSFLLSATGAFADDPSGTLTLGDLASGRCRVIDLTWTLNEKNPYWPGNGYEPFSLRTIATIEQDGVLSKAFSMPEHLGTHIDAPSHFEKGQPSVSDIDPGLFFGPGVVLDISMRAETDHDTWLTVEDLREWEDAHGRIPPGAIVFLRTGWGRFFWNYPRYRNQDARGRLHFPSYSSEAARFLIEQRQAKGIGVDNLSIDRGISKDFAVHHIVNGAGRYGLENVARLERLPPRGFHVIVAPIRIESGTGGPVRIFAVMSADQ